MSRKRHLHPAGRASVISAVIGIALIAVAVMGLVPVVLGWPGTWPWVMALIAAAGFGVRLIVAHMARHRRGNDSGYTH